MNYKISNSKLSVEISSKGGELRSIQDAEGKEYLWQGDVASWTDRGPNLFPYIGRMTDGQCADAADSAIVCCRTTDCYGNITEAFI